MKGLKGFSGCVVELTDGGVVRKTAANAAYSSRLMAQCSKQAQLASLIPAPAVLKDGWSGDLYWFEMEFVEGLDLLEAVDAWGIDVLTRFADRVVEILGACSQLRDGTLASSLFTGKLQQVRATIPPTIDAAGRRTVEELVDRMLMLDWSGIPATASHGDLTLENIIVRHDGTLAFIDFLDGPLSSVCLDIAKLQQDTRSFWKLRPRDTDWPEPGMLDRVILLKYLDDLFCDRLADFLPELAGRRNQLLLFQLLRIVPYCRDAAVAVFLVHRLMKGAAAMETCS